MSSVSYVYTLSSTSGMVSQAVRSIKSITNWVDADNVIVFYTPPRSEKAKQKLSKLGVDLRVVNNISNSFSVSDSRAESHYGEKARVGDVQSDTVVFLDCDTIVLGDITEIVRGDFEFKARPGLIDIPENEWRSLFVKYGKPYFPWMPNAGVMVFKNDLHKRIKEDWRQMINDRPQIESADYQLVEQFSLALLLGNKKVEKMGPQEHAMIWNDESPPDGIVYHWGPAKSSPPKTVKGNLYHAFQALKRGSF